MARVDTKTSSLSRPTKPHYVKEFNVIQRYRKNLPAALAASLLSVVALVVAAPQASAGADACPTGAFCMFEHPNFEGRMMYAIVGDHESFPDLSRFGFDNQVSSVLNKGSSGFCAWEHPNYQGNAVFAAGHTQIQDLRPNYDDIISSAREC